MKKTLFIKSESDSPSNLNVEIVHVSADGPKAISKSSAAPHHSTSPTRHLSDLTYRHTFKTSEIKIKTYFNIGLLEIKLKLLSELKLINLLTSIYYLMI